MDRCNDPKMGRLIESYESLDASDLAALSDHVRGCSACRRELGFIRLMAAASAGQEAHCATHPVEDQLLAFIGAGGASLLPEEISALESHLARCPECKELVSLMQGHDTVEAHDAYFDDASVESPDTKSRTHRIVPLFSDSARRASEDRAQRFWKKPLISMLSAAALILLLFTGVQLADRDVVPLFLSAEAYIQDVYSTRSKRIDTLRPGDPFRICFRITSQAWVYVFYTDSDQRLVPAIPASADEPPLKAAANEWITLPAGESAFVADASSNGVEYIVLAFFESPLDADLFQEVYSLLKNRWSAGNTDDQLAQALRFVSQVPKVAVKRAKIMILD